MQLGTRWSVGSEPPSKLPPVMAIAVADVEAELTDTDTTGWRWTLTWLEGRPIAELDDGTVLQYVPASDSVVREQRD